MQIFILNGIPGSGKSTWIKNKTKELNTDNYLICSADNYFTKDGVYTWDQNKLGAAHKYSHDLFDKALNNPIFDCVFVDNTNLSVSEINSYLSPAEKLGYKVTVVRLSCSPQTAAKRNTHNVPIGTINKMFNRFKNCKFPDTWEVLTLDTEEYNDN